jgi:hypothetical protein
MEFHPSASILEKEVVVLNGLVDIFGFLVDLRTKQQA